MNKIPILLVVVSSLFAQWKHQVDPTTIRQLYVLDQNHIKHYSNQLEWRTDHQIILIHNMQQAITKVNKGKYSQIKSQEIADVIQKYVNIEKQHRKDLRAIQIKLKELEK